MLGFAGSANLACVAKLSSARSGGRIFLERTWRYSCRGCDYSLVALPSIRHPSFSVVPDCCTLKRLALLAPLLLLVLSTIVFSGCGNGAEQERVRQLQVEDFRYVRRPDGARVLRGTLVNPLTMPVQNVQIEVSLLDADNRRVERVLIAVSEVPSEGRTPFRKILNVEAGVQGARIRQIRAM